MDRLQHHPEGGVHVRAGGPGRVRGSSYIDDVVCRERDLTSNGGFDDRYYYLQNWRNDVVAIMDHLGEIKEKIVYDAYGRPSCFSPADIETTGGGVGRPDGIVDASDVSAWSTGSAAWNKDIGNGSGVAIPDGMVNSNDQATITNLTALFIGGGWGKLSSSDVGNRKGYAGYEFDEVLNGSATADNKTLYHVRHRVLAADTGKWLQKDPLGYHDSMDLYEYCQSDAIDKVDAMGLVAATFFSGCKTSRCGTAVVSMTQPQTPSPSLSQEALCNADCASHPNTVQLNMCYNNVPVVCFCRSIDLPGRPLGGIIFSPTRDFDTCVTEQENDIIPLHDCRNVPDGETPRPPSDPNKTIDGMCRKAEAVEKAARCILGVNCRDYCGGTTIDPLVYLTPERVTCQQQCEARKRWLYKNIYCRAEYYKMHCHRLRQGGELRDNEDDYVPWTTACMQTMFP